MLMSAARRSTNWGAHYRSDARPTPQLEQACAKLYGGIISATNSRNAHLKGRQTNRLKDDRRVRAAESEAVRHDDRRAHRARASDDGKAGDIRVGIVEVRGSGEKAVAHHQQAVDGFMDARGAERMPGQRFRRRDRRDTRTEYFAYRSQFDDVA